MPKLEIRILASAAIENPVTVADDSASEITEESELRICAMMLSMLAAAAIAATWARIGAGWATMIINMINKNLAIICGSPRSIGRLRSVHLVGASCVRRRPAARRIIKTVSLHNAYHR